MLWRRISACVGKVSWCDIVIHRSSTHQSLISEGFVAHAVRNRLRINALLVCHFIQNILGILALLKLLARFCGVGLSKTEKPENPQDKF